MIVYFLILLIVVGFGLGLLYLTETRPIERYLKDIEKLDKHYKIYRDMFKVLSSLNLGSKYEIAFDIKYIREKAAIRDLKL